VYLRNAIPALSEVVGGDAIINHLQGVTSRRQNGGSNNIAGLIEAANRVN
jgi:hypothetical protein